MNQSPSQQQIYFGTQQNLLNHLVNNPILIPNFVSNPLLSVNSFIGPNLMLNDIKTYDEKKRNKKEKDKDNKIYYCNCGKSYLSQAALNTHLKRKHPELNPSGIYRGRGRPRKEINDENDFGFKKYNTFLEDEKRKKNSEENNELSSEFYENIFKDIFKEEFKEKFLSKPKSFEDISLLKKLKEGLMNELKENHKKCCDDILLEYLMEFKEIVNSKYFSFMLKFILLLREFFNLTQRKLEEKEKKTEEDKLPSERKDADELPRLSNDFYLDFLENNNFFCFDKKTDSEEIIDLIQHLSTWLLRKNYTKISILLSPV